MRGKRGFEFSFGWIFAIIVGAAIIYLAIYFAVKLVGTQRQVQDTETARELGALLSPIETSIESGKTARIIFKQDARIINDCVNPKNGNVSVTARDNFGAQKISVATKLGIGEQWQDAGVASTYYNKYIFSEKENEGKKFSIFAKPFEMPFEIASLIFLWSEEEEYCFVNPPNEINDEINDLNLNVNISVNVRDCKTNSMKICFFLGQGCDVIVNLNAKSVTKNKKTIYYEDSLIYGAIFADPEIYECQAKRLMRRANELSLLYLDKTEFLSQRGCRSNLEQELANYATLTAMFNNTFQLKEIKFSSQQLEDRNEALLCSLF